MTDVAEPVAPEHTNGIHHPAAASGEKPDKSVPAPAEDAQPGLDGEESDEYEDIDPEDEHEEGAHVCPVLFYCTARLMSL
ncbi:hypothetical protein BD779DRAFT_1488240 [Infundibulicybe gibba]|nr:hypothetical protein BD779DRAFT_1488240 [Infundibulicybe gibba]